ncbi:MAG: hypothetical protein AB7P37_19700, partial [Ramlibacter sp.]
MPQTAPPYLAPSLRDEGFIGVTGTTPYRAPTPEQLDTLRQIYEDGHNPVVSHRIPDGAIVLSFHFDGTQNGLYPPSGESVTNVVELANLMRVANGRDNTFYYSGIGAQTLPSGTLDANGRPAPGSSASNWDSTPFRAGAIGSGIVQQAVEDLERRVNAIRAVNPDADIRIVTTGHSRGNAQANEFTHQINERGIPGLFEPGQASVDHAIRFDPVNMTNGQLRSDVPGNVVQGATVLPSMDERRTIMPPMPQGPEANLVGMPGPHSGGAGSFNQRGVGAIGLSVARNALEAAGVPIAPIPDHLQPDWDQMWMHDSSLDNYGNQIWPTLNDRYYEGSSRTDPSFTQVIRDGVPFVPSANNGNAGEAFDYRVPADPARPDGEQLTVREIVGGNGVSQVTILNAQGEVMLAGQPGDLINRDPQTGRITVTDSAGKQTGEYIPQPAASSTPPPPPPQPPPPPDADTPDGGAGEAETNLGGDTGDTPAPVITTLRVNHNTVFTLNADGDILSEATTLGNGYTQIRDIYGEVTYTDGRGNGYSAQEYAAQLLGDGGGDTDDGTADVEHVTDTRAGSIVGHSLAILQTLQSLGNFNDLSSAQQLVALAGAYNVATSWTGAAMPAIPPNVLSVLNFAAALQTGDAGAVLGS